MSAPPSASGAARLSAAFASANACGRPAFVAYLTAGFPRAADTVPALLAMQQEGVDVVELGVPFSDPMADGGTIQAANMVALANGVTLRGVLALVREARAAGVTLPLVLMGYYNPVLQYGEALLAAHAAAAGVDGFIVVDLPPEHSAPFLALCDGAGLGLAPLATPLTSDARLAAIGAVARGFVYCVSVLGVTGARAELSADLPAFVARAHRAVGAGAAAAAAAAAGAPAPAPALAVGFGLSTAAHVAEVGALPGVGGVVMGSAVVKAIEAGGVEGMRAFLKSVVPRRP